MDRTERQVDVLRDALKLGAPDVLAEVGDRLGLIVNCLNASGYRIGAVAGLNASESPLHRHVWNDDGVCSCGVGIGSEWIAEQGLAGDASESPPTGCCYRNVLEKGVHSSNCPGHKHEWHYGRCRYEGCFAVRDASESGQPRPHIESCESETRVWFNDHGRCQCWCHDAEHENRRMLEAMRASESGQPSVAFDPISGLPEHVVGPIAGEMAAQPLDPQRCDRIVNNGMGEPTECGRSLPCALHDPQEPERG